MSRFHSDERQVPRYRVGRVFLAGDAAHIHSPAGGQGMNTGLQDAGNLGWKLAAAIRGWAPGRLLETYQAERHPVGRAVVRGSGAMLRIVLGLSVPARAARRLLTTVVGPLGLVPPQLANAVSGIGVRYRRRAPRTGWPGSAPRISRSTTTAGCTRRFGPAGSCWSPRTTGSLTWPVNGEGGWTPPDTQPAPRCWCGRTGTWRGPARTPATTPRTPP
jgi:hypothetical protein